ncbi:MAG: hypothetical protein ACYSWW_21530 [Planctomycetota bacterium]|jgi:hypothetical protein
MARGAPGNFNLDYAKQSQFSEGQVNVSVCLKTDYENIAHFQAPKTKPIKANAGTAQLCKTKPICGRTDERNLHYQRGL